MALATTCPSCNTSFKVLPDQLKLRRGTVRCGVCQHVFSGLDHLRYIPDGARANAAGTPIPASVAARIAKDSDPGPTEPVSEAAPLSTDNLEAISEEGMKTAFFMPETVFAATTQIDPNEQLAQPANMPASIQASNLPGSSSGSIDDLLHDKALQGDPLANPHRSSTASNDTDAIDYFSFGKNNPGFTDRRWIFYSGALVLLLVVLALQAVVIQRNEVAARWPELKPTLLAVVEPLGLTISAPRDLGALTIESFELRSSPDPAVFALSALLRNQQTHSVSWPSMELTLTDGQGGLLARRVFAATEYLPFVDANPAIGVNPRSEVPIRLALETRDLVPNGYSVTLFYPPAE